MRMPDIRQLGRCAFELRCEDEALKRQLNSLFQPCNGSASSPPLVIEVDRGGVRKIVNIALKHHDACVWIDAASLISPGGKKILIAGASHAGKSTCTTALALKEKWKVLAEDIVLFDTAADRLICFASPFSLKPGTADRLAAQNCPAPPLVLNEWIPLDGMAAGGEVAAKLDLAFFFEHIADPGSLGPLTLNETVQADFIRRLLPISNLLHSETAIDKLSTYLTDARCFNLSGGSITERLRKINELAGER
jgi:hypothetical protein